MKLSSVFLTFTAITMIEIPTLVSSQWWDWDIPCSGDSLVTEKWDNQRDENRRFCGTDDSYISNQHITCQSFWLPPVRYDVVAIDAVKSCAVCWYYAPVVGCVACATTAIQDWFFETAASIGGALLEIPDQILELAGDWLLTQWDALLSGVDIWKSHYIGAWDFEVRGGVKLHCSQECPCGVCGPRTCLQHQGYIQIKAEFGGYNIWLKNDCWEPIQVAIRYLDATSGNWVSKCWYHLGANEGFYAATGGDRIATRNSVWYVHARSTNYEWYGGSDANAISRSCGGESLSMIRKDYIDEDGDLYAGFTCNSRRLVTTSLRSKSGMDNETIMSNWVVEASGGTNMSETGGLASRTWRPADGVLLPAEHVTYKHQNEMQTKDAICHKHAAACGNSTTTDDAADRVPVVPVVKFGEDVKSSSGNSSGWKLRQAEPDE